MKIYLERSSVCMGDDCTAPNPGEIEFDNLDTLSNIACKIANYLPAMRNSVWTVELMGSTFIYLYFDKNADCIWEFPIKNGKAGFLSGKTLFCRYYYESLVESELNRLGDSADYSSMVEKVKAIEKFNRMNR